MSKKNSLGKELKALGTELASALKQIRSSKEFKDLEREIRKSIKSISSKLGRSLKAAQKSPSASRLKRRVGRVVKVGRAQGSMEARRAQSAASKGLRKIVSSMRQLSNRLD